MARTRATCIQPGGATTRQVVVDPAVLNPVVTNTATLGKADIQKTVTAKDNAAAMHTVARLLRDLKEDIGIHPELVVGGTYYDPCVALVRALIAEGWYPKAGSRCSGFRVQASWLRVWGSGFRVQGSGFRVQGSGFRVQGLGFRV